MKWISVVCTLIIAMLAIGNILALDAAMGSVFGPVYVIGSLIGLLAYASVEPAFYEGFASFRKSMAFHTGSFQRDFNESKEHMKRTISEHREHSHSDIKDGDNNVRE